MGFFSGRFGCRGMPLRASLLVAAGPAAQQIVLRLFAFILQIIIAGRTL